MKKYRNLIILASVLVCLVIVYFILTGINNRKNDETDKYGDTVKTSYTAAEIDINSLYSIKFNYDGTVYSYSLNSGHTQWLWDVNPDLNLDSVYFANMASALESLQSDHKLTLSESELEKYELASPWLTVSVSDNVHGSQTFSFGLLNSFNNCYYFLSSADTTALYMVDAAVADNFMYSPYDMVKDDELPPIDDGCINSYIIKSAGITSVYTYYEDGKDDDPETNDTWYCSVNGADETRCPDDIANGLDTMYGDFSFNGAVAFTDNDKAEFGIDGNSSLTVKYTENKSVTDQNTGAVSTIALDSEVVLLLGYIDSDSRGVYACMSDSALTYLIDGSVLTKLYSSITK